jgi:hypothetical protein
MKLKIMSRQAKNFPRLVKEWNIAIQTREEFPLTKGQAIARGKLYTRAKHRRADYVL